MTEVPPVLLKLDIGCGPNPQVGFEGVDQYAFGDKVKYVMDVRKTPWPFADNSVSDVHAAHFLEHLNAKERCAFLNELYRVLIPKGKATIIVPHWASNRAYGDPTHQWPPVSEMFFYYLLRDWRKQQAPHTDIEFNPEGYSCDFDATWGYNLNPAIIARNQEYQQFAITWYKEAAQDTCATLISRKT